MGGWGGAGPTALGRNVARGRNEAIGSLLSCAAPAVRYQVRSEPITRPRSHHQRGAFYGWPGTPPPHTAYAHAHALSLPCIPFSHAMEGMLEHRARAGQTLGYFRLIGWPRENS